MIQRTGSTGNPHNALPGLFIYLLPGLEQMVLFSSIDLTLSQISTTNITQAIKYTVIPEYVFPSWPHAKTFSNLGDTAAAYCDGAISNYVGSNGATDTNDHLDNGLFFARSSNVAESAVAAISRSSLPTRRVRDGLSNTLATVEFAHIDSPQLSANTYSAAPGNVRRWTMSASGVTGDQTMWSAKAIRYAPNQVVNRALPSPTTSFSTLPPGSFHPGGINALMGDGAVRFVSDMVSPVA